MIVKKDDWFRVVNALEYCLYKYEDLCSEHEHQYADGLYKEFDYIDKIEKWLSELKKDSLC